MLPDFTTIKRELQDRLVRKLELAILGEAPLLAQIKRQTQSEGNRYSLETEDGEIVERPFRQFSSRMDIPARISSAETAQQLSGKLQDMAKDMAKQFEGMLFTTLREVTEQTGNVIHGQGKPISQELILDGLEKVQIDFDEHERPILPTIVLPPEMFTKIKDKFPEWESDPSFQKRRSEILRRKKEEWRDREAHRKLVG